MNPFFPEFRNSEGEVIASWGEAKLFKTLDGKYELVGGSKEDLTAANEWISMFCRDVVVGDGAGWRG